MFHIQNYVIYCVHVETWYLIYMYIVQIRIFCIQYACTSEHVHVHVYIYIMLCMRMLEVYCIPNNAHHANIFFVNVFFTTEFVKIVMSG